MARKKTKVMHVIRDLRCGGVEKLFLLIIDGLQKRGAIDNVGCVVSDKLDFLAPNKAKIITLGLPLNDSFFHVVLMLPFEFFMLMAAILREKPDVIFVHNTSAEQLLASILGNILGKKVVVLKCEQNEIRHILRRFTDPINYFLCHNIVVVSHATENELLSLGIPRSKLSLILNGKQIDSHMLTQKNARLRLGFKSTDMILGMISRTHPLKNHAGVIRAMPELLALRKNIKLVIVGDDAKARYKQALQQLVHDSGLDGSVVFLGERKDVEDTPGIRCLRPSFFLGRRLPVSRARGGKRRFADGSWQSRWIKRSARRMRDDDPTDR